MAEEKQESVSFTIEYFGIGGRGAPLRAAAFIGGLSYKDAFTNGEKHKAVKMAGNRRWSGIPEMTLHDKDGNDVATIGQSNVCLRLIGTMAGLYPENMLQRALVDEVMAACEDVMGLLGPSFPVKDAAKKKAMRLELMKEDKFPYWFGKFELRMTENEARGCKNGFMVGDTMTIADIKMYFGIAFLVSGAVDHIDGDVLLKPVPKVAAFLAMMKANEKVKAFEDAFKAQQAKTKANAEDNVHVIQGKDRKNVYAAM